MTAKLHLPVLHVGCFSAAFSLHAWSSEVSPQHRAGLLPGKEGASSMGVGGGGVLHGSWAGSSLVGMALGEKRCETSSTSWWELVDPAVAFG